MNAPLEKSTKTQENTRHDLETFKSENATKKNIVFSEERLHKSKILGVESLHAVLFGLIFFLIAQSTIAASFTITSQFPGTSSQICDSSTIAGSCQGVAGLPIAGSFTDTFTFTTGANSGGSASVIEISNTTVANITNMTAILDGLAFTPVSTGVYNTFELLPTGSGVNQFPVLTVGQHTITISGTVQNTGMASYGGTLNINPVAAVPLPAAIWLFGAAFTGLVVMVATNKKKR